MVRGTYDDSPGLAQVPLTSDEVDNLLLADGTYFTRDPRRVRHLLTRMRASFGYHIEQMRNLQRDIEHMHAAARTRATPVAAALDALKNLTADEQRQVFDIKAQALVDAVEEANEDAERLRTAAASDANRVRFVLGRVLEDASIPADVRGRIEEALRLLPEVAAAPAGGHVAQDVSHAVSEGGFAVPPRPETAPEVGPGGPGGPDTSGLADALFGPEADR